MTSPSDDLLAQLPWVRTLAARLVFDREQRADLEQEIWHAALRRPPAPGVPLRAWLTAVGQHLAAMLRRSDVRRERRERAAARGMDGRGTAELAAESEAQQRLLAAVNALPEAMRDVVLLRFLEGLPPRTIAQRLQVPVATVRTRLQRALARLREQLDAEFGDRRTWVLALAALPRPRHVVAAAGVLPVLVSLTWTTVTTHKLVAAAAALLLFAVPAALWWSAPARAPLPDYGVAAPVAAALDPPQRGAPAAPAAPAAREAVPAGPARLLAVGTVVDEHGAPIEGAIVRASPGWYVDRMVAAGLATADELQTRTGPDGRFEAASGGAPQDVVHVEITHPDYLATQERHAMHPGTAATVVMVRTHEVALEVQLVERGSGSPVPFFTVFGESPLGDGAGRQAGGRDVLQSPHGAKGTNGSWRGTVRVAAGRPYHLRVSCPGDGRGEWAAPDDPELRTTLTPLPGTPLRVAFDVELDQAERLAGRVQRGRVVDDATGLPVAGAIVSIDAEGGGRTRTVQTRADGTFVAALPRSGAASSLGAAHDDYHPQPRAATQPGSDLVVRLRPRATLRVRVVDENGAAVPRAHLLVRARDDRGFHERRVTDDGGVAELTRLLAGRYHVFVVEHAFAPDDGAITSASFTVAAGERREEVLPIEPPDAVRVSGLLVGGPEGLAPLFVPHGGGRWTPARTRGRAYDAGGLARGDYLVVIAAANDDDDHLPSLLLPKVVVRGLGATAIDLQVPTGFVRGRVVAARDLAALRAVVVPDVPAGGLAADLLASPKLATAVGAPLAMDGSFEVKHVADGAWRLQLRDGATVLAERAITVTGSLDVGDWSIGR